MGDQPEAIARIVQRVRSGAQASCLLGATGTGKTFTMANVIAELGKPALIVSHNKTLAAQLFEELRAFFPHNSVNYFVSYYDFYQPEAYIAARDIYIEKDSSRNDDLDQLRLAATSNLLSRRDTIVVASVSCIFGLGSPLAYSQKVMTITRGSAIDRREFFLSLSAMQYQRSEIEWKRGQFRVRGDTVDVWPAYEKFAIRLELFGDEIEKIELINPVSGELLAEEKQVFLFPAVHYVMPEDQLGAAIEGIRAELDQRVMELRSQGKLLEAQRLLARTKYDLEMIQEMGFCSGIENYSRYMDGREAGERPYTLMDYFDFAPPASAPMVGAPVIEGGDIVRPGASLDLRRNYKDWLLIIDESHVTLPQVRAMYNGDRARKVVLIEHGFRLPSALDNRPLRFEEFESIVPQVLYVSATPGPYELERVGGEIAEQVIRPTGLIDPRVEIHPARGQVADLLSRCRERAQRGERVLVTALTKRLCEDLTNYLDKNGVRVRYLHSEIETLERVEILTDLREGEFDVLVGVNLLREGLDLPEVSLVCVLDADKEGFLRSATSLIQQMGRAARNVNSMVVMYADNMTPAMRAAIEETERRRAKQIAYNEQHGITPRTIEKSIRRGIEAELKARKTARAAVDSDEPLLEASILLAELEAEMLEAAESLEFEKAASLRDQTGIVRELIGQAQAEEGSLMLRRSQVVESLKRVSQGGKRPRRPKKRPH
ncbi:MAG: excinuclease ABC subunit UvrB [Phycisphaeraceae bacterium]|nr:excinuclease ABC subunit UvrB [Phycisphaeraceae bacterium]MCW5762406.1 excinuclease ABC subunit UvrB [Phycisphaeraceae bacterium]